MAMRFPSSDAAISLMSAPAIREAYQLVHVVYQLVRKVLFWPTICSVAVTMDTPDTRSRILAEAIDAFGNRGYVAVSLDDLAEQLGVRKQTILYHFGSKAELFEATIDSAIGDLGETLIGAGTGRTGWLAVEAVVHAVFRIAVRQPARLGILREVMRLGGDWSAQATVAMEPIIARARLFLTLEMRRGHIRQTDPNLLLVSAYSTVMGVATEVEVLRAVGIEPTLREGVRRRRELLKFLEAALR
jgi:TetR/AcrR family transcriptional regulator